MNEYRMDPYVCPSCKKRQKKKLYTDGVGVESCPKCIKQEERA